MIEQVEKTRNTVWWSVLRLTGRLGLVLGITLSGYLIIYRPLQLNWGATNEEVARPMPGDEIQPRPIFNATRVVTINAPPEQIWPWLVQIGYKRAGWYGYDFLDNAGKPSAERIVPELQRMKPGDNLPVWEGSNLEVVTVEPNRYLVWQSYDTNNPTSWTLALYPVEGSQTRLVWRIHTAPYNWTSPTIILLLFTDLADMVAVRENMLGIKARVEGVSPQAQSVQIAEVIFWTAIFLSFLAAAGGFVIRRDWLRPLICVSATGLITTGVVLIKPPVWIDGLAMVVVWTGLWWWYKPQGRSSILGRLKPTVRHQFRT